MSSAEGAGPRSAHKLRLFSQPLPAPPLSTSSGISKPVVSLWLCNPISIRLLSKYTRFRVLWQHPKRDSGQYSSGNSSVFTLLSASVITHSRCLFASVDSRLHGMRSNLHLGAIGSVACPGPVLGTRPGDCLMCVPLRQSVTRSQTLYARTRRKFVSYGKVFCLTRPIFWCII
jgi:hypothetical protein